MQLKPAYILFLLENILSQLREFKEPFEVSCKNKIAYLPKQLSAHYTKMQ